MEEGERNSSERLDIIIRGLRELSADLDHLLLLGSDVKELSRNLDRFL
ncbi:hypothetical protein EHEL_080605 [Encephalitozoon hellem ATCC 50504]|uniref:Uncharacterized protein n=1 Tax=Encephalitozoon hellem TaxID=27973 RepID=A0ABY8CK29_ENCHE|nr:uncharacterized protein EHEL_080605 [Encephalitozoon hellem ATCC 50504]AHL28960.1 hypothetical protein EHEL_080605 [Encephalitozoon hellem ATCC 50504]WEL39218.1 hypothetical protein PFJ87_08g00770 [Encephalitozoon hellem]